MVKEARKQEVRLLACLLANPGLVAKAQKNISHHWIEHPGLRRLLVELYISESAGEVPSIDSIRAHVDHQGLLEKAEELRARGLASRIDPAIRLRDLIEFFMLHPSDA